MSELLKVAGTVFGTVVGGTIVYVFGQLVSKFFIDPIHDQKRLIAEIADSLIFYAYVYSKPQVATDEIKEASNKYRQQAAALQARTHLIPWYGFFRLFHFLVLRPNALKAAERLISLSNSINTKNTDAIPGTVEEIKRLLNLKFE